MLSTTYSYPWGQPLNVVSFDAPFVMGKQRPRHLKNGHTYTPARTRRAEKMIGAAYQQAAKEEGVETAPEGWPVAINITVRKRLPISAPKRVIANRDLTKPDLDNVAKLVMDALNGVAYQDDRQIVELNVARTLRVRGTEPEALHVEVLTPQSWDPQDNDIRRDDA